MAYDQLILSGWYYIMFVLIFQAWHVITTQKVEIECYRYWSENNKFISITTSTVHPRVNEYMVFTVRANFFVDEVNYLVSRYKLLLTALR